VTTGQVTCSPTQMSRRGPERGDGADLKWFTDDSRRVRFAHVRETSIELRKSSPILRELSEVNVITLSQCPPLQHGWCSLLDQPCTALVLKLCYFQK